MNVFINFQSFLKVSDILVPWHLFVNGKNTLWIKLQQRTKAERVNKFIVKSNVYLTWAVILVYCITCGPQSYECHNTIIFGGVTPLCASCPLYALQNAKSGWNFPNSMILVRVIILWTLCLCRQKMDSNSWLFNVRLYLKLSISWSTVYIYIDNCWWLNQIFCKTAVTAWNQFGYKWYHDVNGRYQKICRYNKEE